MKGHCNRIFSVKFDPQNENFIYSGGWDCNVNKWDLRMGKTAGSAYGPYICGDSIDVCEDKLLTGSYRTKESLQIWDTRKMTLVENIDWNIDNANDQSSIYAAQFSKYYGDYIIAGGSDNNCVKVFDMNNNRVVTSINDMEKPCLTVDSTHDGNTFIFGTAGGKVMARTLRD
jgi:COMPASS component SWD3